MTVHIEDLSASLLVTSLAASVASRRDADSAFSYFLGMKDVYVRILHANYPDENRSDLEQIAERVLASYVRTARSDLLNRAIRHANAEEAVMVDVHGNLVEKALEEAV